MKLAAFQARLEPCDSTTAGRLIEEIDSRALPAAFTTPDSPNP
jgi:hypothetical protein